MNAETKVAQAEGDNLAIWAALSVTDPSHTKQFKRAGGFSGTAIKPIWVVRRLTEQFGPCGKGWGMDEPKFEVVHGDNREVLVFCTVAGWYWDMADVKKCHVYGVGGDKIVTYIKANEQYNRPERWENDDEAFKKAFTDAVNNAFKFIGVGADVHMGQFDDSKYVEAAREHFSRPDDSEDPRREPEARALLEGPHAVKTKLRSAVHAIVGKVREAASVELLNNLLRAEKETIAQAERYWPSLINGHPDIEEDTGLKGAVALRRQELASEPEYGGYQKLLDSMNDCETLAQLTNWMAANERDIEALSDPDGRKFEQAREKRESAIMMQDKVNA